MSKVKYTTDNFCDCKLTAEDFVIEFSGTNVTLYEGGEEAGCFDIMEADEDMGCTIGEAIEDIVMLDGIAAMVNAVVETRRLYI